MEAIMALPPRLERRQVAILERISKLERALEASLPGPQAGAAAPAAAAPAPAPISTLRITPDASPTQQRLEAELVARGCVSAARFVRVPPDYYDQPLEFRRECLAAASVEHLCKAIVMENTRAHPSVVGWADPAHSKYYVVMVQYSARFNADKLKAALMEVGGRRFGRQFYNMRLAPEEVNDALTGFSHNAVSPVGMREALPIVLSHRIAQLQPEEFWMGAGEVDLKLGMSVREFIQAYQPLVLDCTYD